MAKIKYDELDTAAGAAELQSKSSFASEKKDMLVRGVPVDWTDLLTEHGHKFASYARIAVQEKMKRDGIL